MHALELSGPTRPPMTAASAPRIYCIPATAAPVAAVFRRGPSNWSHVGRWDLQRGHYEPGAWIGGRLFPRRSDLSPDGKVLCYFAHRPSSTWQHGEAYVALSKLPWLSALHVIPTCGTWTRGFHFVDGACSAQADIAGIDLPRDIRLRATRAVQFATERRRGWTEAADSPPRAATDAWDEQRNARLCKQQPGGDALLCVESVGWPGGEFRGQQAIDGLRVRYWLEHGGDLDVLDDLQWADWDARGRLLCATRDGRLQIRILRGRTFDVVFEADLAALAPAPVAAPAWAQGW